MQRLDSRPSQRARKLTQDERYWFRSTSGDLEQTAIDLQLGTCVDTGYLVMLLEKVSAHLSEDMDFDEKRVVYLFVMSVLSSDSVERSTLSELPFWQQLMNFTTEFDKTYWETAI